MLAENVLANARQSARVVLRQQQDLDYDILVAEPAQNDKFAVEMRFLAPNGTQVSRRFSRNSTLNIVLSWVQRTLRELSITCEEGFRLCERYPRKVYDQSQYDLTLEALKFWSSGRQTPQRSSVLVLELL